MPCCNSIIEAATPTSGEMRTLSQLKCRYGMKGQGRVRHSSVDTGCPAERVDDIGVMSAEEDQKKKSVTEAAEDSEEEEEDFDAEVALL